MPWLVRVGGARPPPLITFTITSKVAVYAPAEWTDTLTLFHLYENMYSVSSVSHSFSVSFPYCVSHVYCAGIFEKSKGARNRVGISFLYRPASSMAGGIASLESILGLHKYLKIRPLFPVLYTLTYNYPNIKYRTVSL